LLGCGHNWLIREADGPALLQKRAPGRWHLRAPAVEAVTPHVERIIQWTFTHTDALALMIESENDTGASSGPGALGGVWHRMDVGVGDAQSGSFFASEPVASPAVDPPLGDKQHNAGKRDHPKGRQGVQPALLFARCSKSGT